MVLFLCFYDNHRLMQIKEWRLSVIFWKNPGAGRGAGQGIPMKKPLALVTNLVSFLA
jgi:hypothetical protein